MELTKLIDHPVTETFTDRGEKVEITFNANAFTPDFLRTVAANMRAASKARQAAKKPAKTGTRAAKKPKAQIVDEVENVAANLDFSAAMLELRRKVYAEFLACDGKTHVLVDWDVTNIGEPTKPTLQVLMRLHPRTVIGIWDWCIETVTPKDEAPAAVMTPTQENTNVGSFGAVTSEESRTM